MYTFSSPPTVIPSPRIRFSPPRFGDPAKKSTPDSSPHRVDKNRPVADDSNTELKVETGQTTAESVSLARLGVSDNVPSAAVSRLSPMQQSIRRSSLREIPEAEIRRSGVSTITIQAQHIHFLYAFYFKNFVI